MKLDLGLLRILEHRLATWFYATVEPKERELSQNRSPILPSCVLSKQQKFPGASLPASTGLMSSFSYLIQGQAPGNTVLSLSLHGRNNLVLLSLHGNLPLRQGRKRDCLKPWQKLAVKSLLQLSTFLMLPGRQEPRDTEQGVDWGSWHTADNGKAAQHVRLPLCKSAAFAHSRGSGQGWVCYETC